MLRFPAVLGLLLLASTSAFATDPSTQVSIAGDLFRAMEPYIVEVLVAVIMAIGGIVWQQLQARLKVLQTKQAVDIEAHARDAFQVAARNAAGRWIAKQEGSIANLKVDVHSPGIAEEVAKVQAFIPDKLQQLNISPKQIGNVVASTIVAKIGLAQASSPTSAPTITAPTAGTQNISVMNEAPKP